MKKGIVIGIVIGAILFGSIGVYAGTVLSKDIAYTKKDGTTVSVESALNDLYTRTNLDEYIGNTTITPTSSNTILNTKDKLLKSNITINAIPNTYKNLMNNTTVENNNLLKGITAYNSDGTLITGTIDTNCVKGSFVSNDDAYNGGQLISSGITPNTFVVYWPDKRISYYDSTITTETVILYDPEPMYQERDFSINYRIDNNKLYLILSNSRYLNQPYTYIICS